VDVLETVDQARDVVQIRERRITVFTGFHIHDVHRRTAGAEVHLVPGELHLAPGRLPVEHEIARRHGEGVLHQRAREQQPALVGVRPAGGRHQIDTRGYGIREADLLQHVESGTMNALDVGIGERLVTAAQHTRKYGLLCLALGRRPQRLAPGAPTHPLCSCHAHAAIPLQRIS
jgi:hypothetical protein